MEIPGKMLRRNLKEIHYDIAHILVGGAPRQHDLGTSIAANSSFIMTSVFQNKGELEEPYFLLLKFSADIRQTFSIHSKKKKKSVSWWVHKITTHSQKHGCKRGWKGSQWEKNSFTTAFSFISASIRNYLELPKLLTLTTGWRRRKNVLCVSPYFTFKLAWFWW